MRLVCLSVLFLAGPAAADQPKTTEQGTVSFVPGADEKETPERYRLTTQMFSYRLSKLRDLPVSGVEIHELRFPSPVKSPCPENNTVYAEYYRPIGKGPFPCVIVLDITGGDQSLSRLIAGHLAQHKIGGLFVQMAYYGPRRPPGSPLRLLSPDVGHTLEAVRQTVLDLRWAAAWMGSRPEIDKTRLGIMGTSLGSFVAALAGEMEPKLIRVGVMLGGGGFVDAFYDDPRVAAYRRIWERLGGSKEKVAAVIAPVDPITCAARLKEHRLLIIAAKKDEIVPPRMAEALWNASGRQKIVWLNSGHYTAALYLTTGLKHVVEHFGAK